LIKTMPSLKTLALPPRPAAILLLIFSMLCFPTGAALAKQLFVLFDAQGAAALRVFVSALIMAMVFRPWRGEISRKDIVPLVIYGAAMGLMNLSFYMALQTVPLGVVVALEFTGPLTVALLSSKNRLDFLWAALAACGILLFMPFEGIGRLDPLGVFYALGAGLFWALYIVFGQKAGRGIKGPRTTALGIIIASCVIVPVGAPHIDVSLLLAWQIIGLVLTLAVLSSALPYALEMFALQNLPRKTFGIFMSLEPGFSALIGLVILSEVLTLRQCAAIFCVVLASAGSAAFSKASIAKEEVQV
jgi:inner membrane transporter RhtA